MQSLPGPMPSLTTGVEWNNSLTNESGTISVLYSLTLSKKTAFNVAKTSGKSFAATVSANADFYGVSATTKQVLHCLVGETAECCISSSLSPPAPALTLWSRHHSPALLSDPALTSMHPYHALYLKSLYTIDLSSSAPTISCLHYSLPL